MGPLSPLFRASASAKSGRPETLSIIGYMGPLRFELRSEAPKAPMLTKLHHGPGIVII